MFSEEPSYRTSILDLIKGSDVGINDIVIESLVLNAPGITQKMPQELKDFLLKQMKGEEE